MKRKTFLRDAHFPRYRADGLGGDVTVGFLVVWHILFVGRWWRVFLYPAFAALLREDRHINERNDTKAMGRFSDIIIAMWRV